MKEKIKKYIPAAICVFVLFLLIHYWDSLVNAVMLVIGAASPLLVGFVIAYIVNILMSFYERHYFAKHASAAFVRKSKRIVCLIGAVLTFAVIVGLVVWLVIPELISCVTFLITKTPATLQEIAANYLSENVVEYLRGINWSDYLSDFSSYMLSGLGGVAGAAYTAITSVFSGIVTFVLGFVFAIYLLFSKERWLTQIDRVTNCCMCTKIKQSILHVLSVLDESFHKYIVGQCAEAVILGMLCMIGMWIFRFPYAGMIGALVGITAFIPIVGAFIGGGVGAIMIYTESPIKALLFIIFIIVLQQIEGNLIYPRVVGKTVGIHPLLILAAVTIGGGTLGILGIAIGVPVVVTIYKLVKEHVEQKELAERQAINTQKGAAEITSPIEAQNE